MRISAKIPEWKKSLLRLPTQPPRTPHRDLSRPAPPKNHVPITVNKG